MRHSRFFIRRRRSPLTAVVLLVPQAAVLMPKSLVKAATVTGIPSLCNVSATCFATPGLLKTALDLPEITSLSYTASRPMCLPAPTPMSMHCCSVPWMTEARSSTQLSTM